MWWTADPPRPFQLRPVPICSALRFLVAGLLPAFIYRRVWRLSQGTACSFRVTLMVRPLLLAEPGPGDASCTIWTLSVFFSSIHFQAGRPSSGSQSFRLQLSAFFRPYGLLWLPVSSSLAAFRYLLAASNLAVFFSFSTASDLAIFCCLLTASDLAVFCCLNCFRSFDALLSFNSFLSSNFLRSFDRFRFSCDSNLSIVVLLSNGGLKLLLRTSIVKLWER